MNKYNTILAEINKDVEDSLLSINSVIQVDFTGAQPCWYYSHATMQRDFLSAKKDLDEGILDFTVFEKIQQVYENYLAKRSTLTELTVEEALAQLEKLCQ